MPRSFGADMGDGAFTAWMAGTSPAKTMDFS
jgi:hypothetical protein